MYHIKDDRRCQRSAIRICHAFKELLDVKLMTDITVSDIQRTSGVGRSTFYRLFDNIDDVLLYVAEEEFRYMVELYHEMSWPDFTAEFIRAIAAESRGLINLSTAGKMHILSRALRTNLTLEAQKSDLELSNTFRYQIAIFVGSCISLVTAWEENGRQESLDELALMVLETLDLNIRSQ